MEWLQALTGGATVSDLMERAEKVEQHVPGARATMLRVTEDEATFDDTIAAAYIALTESSLNALDRVSEKIDSVTTATEDRVAMITKLGMIRELIDTALQL